MTDFETGIAAIKDVLGADGVIDQENHEHYITEWRGLWRGSCSLAIKPKSTKEVSSVIKICNESRIPIVPQGGNTGLVGGAVPSGGVLLSTERLNKIKSLDPVNMTLTCEAGCILNNIQKACDDADRLFPLSLGAEGSCQIGGNLSTNAGGVQVLRYGNARDLVLGLEVVLPDGRIWDGLRGLRKDNTGYDLKHLFMGAEGTLGVITGAILKLFPRPQQTETAIVAMNTAENATQLFSRMTVVAGGSLTGFELMSGLSFSLPIKNLQNIINPFESNYDWLALVELTSSETGAHLRNIIEDTLSKAIDDNLILNAVLAENEKQRGSFWKIRETIPEAQVVEGASIKNDITIPVSRVPEFLEKADKAVSKIVNGVRPVSFGHIGDGNIHYNLSQPHGGDAKAFLNEWHNITNAVNEIVYELGGSFSAEHGIGKLKRRELVRYRPSTEISIMRDIKKTLDPNNIMNPGKIFEVSMFDTNSTNI